MQAFSKDPRDELDPSGNRFVNALEAGGLPRRVASVYARYHALLSTDGHPYMPEIDLQPAAPDPIEQFDHIEPDALRDQAVMIKLNGGLGTTMGLLGPKCMLKVKEGHDFLQISVRHARHVGVPLVLMNSFATDAGTRASLEREGLDGADVDCFVQHRLPKVCRETLRPVSHPAAPHLQWAPPGHGDLYLSLWSSGVLDRLIAAGRRYAFVSNIDNLGASFDPRLLAHFASKGLTFMMEVTRRTVDDQKGGHLAWHTGRRRLVLREVAQCSPEDRAHFGDIERHRYFNTNNIWLDLIALRDALVARNGYLGLPLIRNRKTVDPRDPRSKPVYQLETAIGSAIEVFERADAVAVPRSRFMPVKSCADLLVMRSDATVLTDDWRLRRAPERALPGLPRVELDRAFFAHVDALDARCGDTLPSLRDCRSLTVRGDVLFPPGVRLTGDVTLHSSALP